MPTKRMVLMLQLPRGTDIPDFIKQQNIPGFAMDSSWREIDIQLLDVHPVLLMRLKLKGKVLKLYAIPRLPDDLIKTIRAQPWVYKLVIDLD